MPKGFDRHDPRLLAFIEEQTAIDALVELEEYEAAAKSGGKAVKCSSEATSLMNNPELRREVEAKRSAELNRLMALADEELTTAFYKTYSIYWLNVFKGRKISVLDNINALDSSAYNIIYRHPQVQARLKAIHAKVEARRAAEEELKKQDEVRLDLIMKLEEWRERANKNPEDGKFLKSLLSNFLNSLETDKK